MNSINTRSTFLSPVKVGLCVFLSVMLILVSMPLTAFAAKSSEELQKEYEVIESAIGELQDQINQANKEYEVALEENEKATAAMEEAQERIVEAEERIEDLQDRLGTRVNTMYRNGNITFFDVLVEAKSFEEFLTSLDMLERINSQDAELVQETKDARQEAQDARDEFEAQKIKAEEEMDKAQALAAEMESKRADLKAEAEKITVEIAEALAREELEAEEARRAAAAAEAAHRNIPGTSTASSGRIVGNGTLSHPCPDGSVSSRFGWREFTQSFHQGLDFAAGAGTPYYAAADGTVIAATNGGGYNGGAGNWVVIAHGNGLVTKYMHSTTVFVSVGQSVTRGQNIGTVGNTGHSYGAHLHFQVELNGKAVNPEYYL